MASEKSATAERETRTRYGIANPEWVENELWRMTVDEGWSGYGLQQHLGLNYGDKHFEQSFAHSGYRDSDPGPFWSWSRFGRTSTALPDGRIIHIAGEHEDSYDPYFCIYNDVVVEHPGGLFEFFLYPKDVFPPTDFHTATLLGEEILLIGSLGYYDLRRPGETQVMMLDTRTLQMKSAAMSGEGPGWISDHIVERLDETKLLVVGGNVQTPEELVANPNIFEIDLTTMTWQRRAHGDQTIFPVSKAHYEVHKSPRFGTANPERADNPFWLEMITKQWPPSRARLHFGDLPSPQPDPIATDIEAENSELERSRREVVWTAARERVLTLSLRDGRELQIGGEINDYDDESADPWTYNDVIVKLPNGGIEIYTYPLDAFPFVTLTVGFEIGDTVLIVGLIVHKRHPERARGPAVMRLDTRTYKIEEVSVETPADWILVSTGYLAEDRKRVIFYTRRKTNADPEMAIALDVETLSWSSPFPHAHIWEDDDC